jgi:hypothetical protein
VCKDIVAHAMTINTSEKTGMSTCMYVCMYVCM